MSSKLILFLVYVYFRQVFGLAINDTRVHYGRPINVEQAPYQVALLNRGEHYCGGSILTRQHILTAAHCIERQDIRRMQIRLGANGPRDKRGVLINIKQVFVHPQYSGYPTAIYDVAVAVLVSVINYNERMQPIKLPSRQPDAGTVVLASGWGETETSPVSSETLLAVESKVAPVQECRKYAHSHQTYFCITISKFGVCHGDSGGPLVDVARREVVGISSFVAPKCRGNPGPYGSYFSNVHFLRPFIDRILQQGKNFTEH